jgi:hypothetical protein
MQTCLLFLTALTLCACPGSSGPNTVCSKMYDKCMLSTGVLGVCNPVDCPAGQDQQTAPCLVCRSQH